MDYKELLTDQLVILVTKTGMSLPDFCYDTHKYTTEIPGNIPTGAGVTGILKTEFHDSFHAACVHLLDWHDGLNEASQSS